jgi:hypothetical protein
MLEDDNVLKIWIVGYRENSRKRHNFVNLYNFRILENCLNRFGIIFL